MAIETLDTKNFDEAEVAMKTAAQLVEDLKMKLDVNKTLFTASWVGEGRGAYDRLFHTVDVQIKDISQEFWDMYNSLCDAHVAYLEADDAVANAIKG